MLVIWPKVPVRKGSDRVVEVRVVEDVVEVSADAERQPLRDLEVLVDGEVRVEEPGTTVVVAQLLRERSDVDAASNAAGLRH